MGLLGTVSMPVFAVSQNDFSFFDVMKGMDEGMTVGVIYTDFMSLMVGSSRRLRCTGSMMIWSFGLKTGLPSKSKSSNGRVLGWLQFCDQWFSPGLSAGNIYNLDENQC